MSGCGRGRPASMPVRSGQAVELIQKPLALLDLEFAATGQQGEGGRIEGVLRKDSGKKGDGEGATDVETFAQQKSDLLEMLSALCAGKPVEIYVDEVREVAGDVDFLVVTTRRFLARDGVKVIHEGRLEQNKADGVF